MFQNPSPTIRPAGLFTVAFSAGAAAFASSASVIALKLLIVRTGALPRVDYGGVATPLLAFSQNSLVTPGFIAVLIVLVAALAGCFERWIVGSRFESVVTYSVCATAFSLGLTPFVDDGGVYRWLPMLIVLPVFALLTIMASRRMFSLGAEIVFGAALPAGYLFFKMTDLLADTGVAAAFPITLEFIQQDTLSVMIFAAGLNLGFFLPFVIGARILSTVGKTVPARSLINFALLGCGVWLILFVDYLLERLDAFPALMSFRLGLEGVAFLMMMPAARDAIGAGRRQAVAGALAIVASVAAIFLPLDSKATLYATGLSMDAEVKRMYSTLLDRDGDGASVFFGEGDCDDGNFKIRPGRSDVPLNGVDENCLGGDLSVADPAPAQWRLTELIPPRKRKIILVTVDTLRSDAVFAAAPVMPELNAFAHHHTGFPNGYSFGGATAIALLNLFYPEPVLSREGAKQKSIFDYLQEAGYTSHCFYGSNRPSSASITVNVMNRCGALNIIAGNDLTLVPSGEEVLTPALRFIKNAPDNVFVWIHLDDIHDYTIYRAGAGYQSRFLFDLAPHLTSYQHLKTVLREKYLDRARYLDRALGQSLLLELENSPALADALFILTGDHGEEFLEHNGIFHGATLYEETIKVPIIVKDGRNDGISQRAVAHRDAVHTIMESIGFARRPAPALTLRSEIPERTIVNLLENVGSFAVRQGRYKSIINYRNNAQMLFDLESDPGETQDIAKTQPDLAQRFLKITDFEARQIIKR